MKRILVCLVAGLALAGCGNTIGDMTPEQAVHYVTTHAHSKFLRDPDYAAYALGEMCIIPEDPDLVSDAKADLPMLEQVADHSLCKRRQHH